MLDDAKTNLVRHAPWLAGRPGTQPSWARLLLNVAAYELVMSAFKAVFLTALVWTVRRYWWPGLPGLGYLPAVAIVFFARGVWTAAASASAPASATPQHGDEQ